MSTEVYEDWFNVSLFDKKCGFTLAELLITIGLIGAIGALTIPTLAFNYRGKVLEQQFRSTYSDIREIGSRMNYERGDVGEFAYACVNSTAPEFRCGTQTTDGKNAESGTFRWASEFVSYLPGGVPIDKKADYSNGISNKLKELYKEARAPQGPFHFDRHNYAGIVCDNGGIWTDMKGRIWTFNAENQFICVDINGTAAPNKLNVDTFVFKPMSAKEMAIYIYDDSAQEHFQNYSGQFVPCDAPKIWTESNSVNECNKVPLSAKCAKGSGSAVDWCYFNEPIENIAAMPFKDRKGNKEDVGYSANKKRQDLTRANTYWKDYINYR